MINWRYIKGLNEDNGANTLYTFLSFQTAGKATSFENSPILYVNTANDPTSPDEGAEAYLGHIITQCANNQHIDTPFEFLNNLSIRIQDEAIFSCDFNGIVSKKQLVAEQALIFSYSGSNTLDFRIQNTAGNSRDLDFTAPDADSRFRFNYNGTNWLNLDKNGIGVNGNITTTDGNITTTNGNITTIYGKCEAQYFNATSDRRAKDNLKILNFKALDLINHTNLYSFIYKDTNTPSIGIIAQDVQSVNIEGFKLVDNENATGQDMDYMSIHESKLVYILWQAIKEQQKEIEELKKRLN